MNRFFLLVGKGYTIATLTSMAVPHIRTFVSASSSHEYSPPPNSTLILTRSPVRPLQLSNGNLDP